MRALFDIVSRGPVLGRRVEQIIVGEILISRPGYFMSFRLQEQLQATGKAQVLVVLKSVAATPPLPAAGATAATVAKSASTLQAHFLDPSETRDGALIAAARRLAKSKKSPAHKPSGPMVLQMAIASDGPTTSLESLVKAQRKPPKAHVYPNLGLMLGTVDEGGLAALRNSNEVSEVLSAPEISLIRPVNSALVKLPRDVTWGLERLGIPKLWDAGVDGTGTLVGHLDTGVDGSHPALKDAISAFIETDAVGEIVPGAKPHDSAQHGTHTAGTIAGRPIGTTSFGVAPGAKLASAMVIEGGNVIPRILKGLDWVVGQGVKVLSMSLGLRGFVDDFEPIVQILRQKGILPVFAVGNEGPATSRSPGNYVEALSVGSIDKDDSVSDFSSSQRFTRPDNPLVPDIVSPGRDVISCVPGGQYMMMSGTSMATPHVAGLAALLFQAKPGATPDEVEKAIFDSCTRPAGMPEDRGNRGIPDAVKAYTLLTGQVPQAAAATGGAGRKTKAKGASKRPAKKKKTRAAAPSKHKRRRARA